MNNPMTITTPITTTTETIENPNNMTHLLVQNVVHDEFSIAAEANEHDIGEHCDERNDAAYQTNELNFPLSGHFGLLSLMGGM